MSSSHEKGVSIYITLILLFVLFGLAMGLSALILGQLKILSSMGDSIVAYYAGEAGVEEMIYQTKTETSFPGSITGSLSNNSSFEVEMYCAEGVDECVDACSGSPCTTESWCDVRFCPISKGTFQDTNRSVRVKY